MVYFLVFMQSLVDLLFDWTDLPVNGESTIRNLHVIFSSLLPRTLNDSLSSSFSVFFERLKITETVVFESKTNNFDIAALHEKVIASVSWLIRP